MRLSEAKIKTVVEWVKEGITGDDLVAKIKSEGLVPSDRGAAKYAEAAIKASEEPEVKEAPKKNAIIQSFRFKDSDGKLKKIKLVNELTKAVVIFEEV